jgi:hypothetical protein
MAFIGNTTTSQQYTAQVAYFSGNGSTTAFTLPASVASAAQILVHVANVAQNPNTAFTVSGTTLTFTSAPPSGSNNIWVLYTSPQAQTIAPSAGTVNTTQLGNITNINSVGSNLTLQTNGNTAVTIDSNNFVGVGTSSTNPIGGNTNAKNLTVSGDGTIVSADGRLVLVNPIAYASQNTSTTAGRIYFIAPNASSGTTYNGASIDALTGGSGGTGGYGLSLRLSYKADNGTGVVGAFLDYTGRFIVGTSQIQSYSNAAIQSFGAIGSGATNFAQPSLAVSDTTSATAGVGGAIGFYGRYSTSIPTDFAFTGGIQGVKANSTQGDTACNLNFYTRPTLTAPVLGMSLLSTGTLQFPVSGQGVQFSNSSALTNSILNDYETGTFTPTITASGGGAATYTLQAGYYVKVGAMVTCSWQIGFAVNTLSGSIYFSGLPFASVNSSSVFSAGSVGFYLINTAITGIYIHLGPNTTSITNVRINTAASANANTNLTNTNLSTGNTFVVSITYPANF